MTSFTQPWYILDWTRRYIFHRNLLFDTGLAFALAEVLSWSATWRTTHERILNASSKIFPLSSRAWNTCLCDMINHIFKHAIIWSVWLISATAISLDWCKLCANEKYIFWELNNILLLKKYIFHSKWSKTKIIKVEMKLSKAKMNRLKSGYDIE